MEITSYICNFNDYFTGRSRIDVYHSRREYDQVIDPANGKTIVLPDSFHFVEGNRPDFFDIFFRCLVAM